MDAISPFIPLATMMIVIPAIYGLIVKISARLLQYKEVSWIKGFIFAIIVGSFSLLLNMASMKLGFAFSSYIGVAIGLVLTLFIGGWFFRKRGKNVEGDMLGWLGAIKLTALSYVIFIGLGGILAIGSKVALSAIRPSIFCT